MGDQEYVPMRVTDVGYTDRVGLQGLVVLTSDDGKRFPITAFSGEIADHIQRFIKGDRTSIPTIYKLVEELAESQSLYLESVQIYPKSSVLRANLVFRGKGASLELKNYRASDSIALATYYDAPITLRKDLLERTETI
ncbi:MAG: bifunctional nuclease family protein [Thaumarchaeota archaeon]|nr:bifunctional nuclease family protein [Nitrososphaerota archaeon]